jgi:valyl-tRNA synthetase
MQELAKQYRPIEHEGRIWERWEEAKAFHAQPTAVVEWKRKPYAMVIPPPNVTAALHLGHAFNNTLQDILVRSARMKGYEAMWMPGTDHAGIATQAVVERRVFAEEGKRRSDFERDAFIAKIQAYKDEYEGTITNQLKKMGCSCDWSRQRFTMDEQCAAAVYEAFFRLFRDGLIYRGKRLVNWDPVLQTAVADDECYDAEIDGNFYYLRYPLAKDSGGSPVTWNDLVSRGFPEGELPAECDRTAAAYLTVATTRPETYLGDTAVAISPKDPRAKAMKGLFAKLPLVGRVIPIVEDSYVVLPERFATSEEEKNDPKAKMATGFLKVTPAHDPNDWEIGQRHKLAAVNIFAPDGSVSDKHGWKDTGAAAIFVGMPREKARNVATKELEKLGLFEGKKPTRHSVKHSDRSKAVVEPYLSDQWYVKVTDDAMAPAANRVLHNGELAFYPARYSKNYEQWHTNIRDWCISRQLWWGHRIPVWSKKGFAPAEAATEQSRLQSSLAGAGAVQIESVADGTATVQVCLSHAGRGHASVLQCAGFTQDPDVLDTWFSSALWPLSTMGWPNPNAFPGNAGMLDAFNPTSVLSTAREIITLWVSRMVMFNRYFLGQDDAKGAGNGRVPFKDVFIHAVIQDGQGQKMSKSLGNGVDPLDIIESHGADAMRFTLCHMSTQTQDVKLPVDMVCPHSGAVFQPKMITIAGGNVVPAPTQNSPKDGKKQMVTAYGVASGQAKPSAEMPLAKNTSSKFDLGRNFATKLWNATRFALGILAEGGAPAAVTDLSELSLNDRWMLSRLAKGIAAADEAIKNYQFSEYAQSVYELLWNDFCDWYIESIKQTALKQDAAGARQRAVLRAVLDAIVRLLHPVMPYVTEAIFESLSQAPNAPVKGLTFGSNDRASPLLCLASWPVADAALIDPTSENRFARVQAFAAVVRDIRARQQVKPSRKVTLHTADQTSLFTSDELALTQVFCGIDTVTTASVSTTAPTAAGQAIAFQYEGASLALSNLRDAVEAAGPTGSSGGDAAAAEKARLTKLVADLTKSVATFEGRLANPGYTDKAPPHMVQQTRDQMGKAKQELAAAEEALKALG